MDCHLFAAYGREYFTQTSMWRDWESGKDFSIQGFGGPYCSVRDVSLLQQTYNKVWLVTHLGDMFRVA